MNTNMKELSFNEMEQANGGIVITTGTLAVIGLCVGAVSLACDCVALGRKIYKDVKKKH